MKLILLRHGESQWNLENRFTGWHDVDLTKKGMEEAEFSANEIIKNNLQIDSVYTSLLKRAIKTTKIVSNIIGFPEYNINYEWRLNERHYGDLQGLNKSETAAKFGENQVKIWRRSYDIAPPLIKQNDKRHPKFNKKFNNIESALLPRGESLKEVIERLIPFWKQYFETIKNNKGVHLIVAHSNSLRAIVKILDKLNEKEIVSLNIPTGVPLVYHFDSSFNIFKKEYLIENSELEKKQSIIKNQGKIK